MATTNFHARLERIQRAQAAAPSAKPAHFRTPGMAGIGALKRKKLRKRHPVTDHFFSIAIGIVLGALITVGFIGLTDPNSPWGVETRWHDILYFPIMAGFALAPVFLIAALILASRRPGFALYALGYVSGIVIPLMF